MTQNPSQDLAAGSFSHLQDLAFPAPGWQCRHPRLIGKPSGWWAHVPFAAWLVEACQPAVLVELGTHHGVSYAAFCETVLQCGLPTRCYAVDHWRGDAHAGSVGDQVYDELERFNEQHYAAFSQLIRADFDSAVHGFADASIDLLHIDGFHTYEAVRHDYETWRCKLSPGAIVVLHDTNVRRDGFGVYRLFAELAVDHPHFEFMHGHGLGVMAAGAQPPAALRELFAAAHGPSTLAIRERFSQLGALWSALAREKEQQSSFRQQVDALDGHRRDALAAHEASRNELMVLTARLDAEIEERTRLAAQAGRLNRTERERDVALARVVLMQARIDEATLALQVALPGATQPDASGRDTNAVIERDAARCELLQLARSLDLAVVHQNELTVGLAEARRLELQVHQTLDATRGQKDELLAANEALRRHTRLFADAVRQMISDLLQRHSDVAGLGAMAPLSAAVAAPSLRAWLGRYARRVGTHALPAGLDWLKPVLRRRRAQAHPVARVVRLSMLFDASWYQATYPDVGHAGLDPAYHYAVFGGAEGRDPSPWFSTGSYLKHNPDVAHAQLNALFHYEAHGRRDGRPLTPRNQALQELGRPPDGTAGVLNDRDAFRAASERALRIFLAGGQRLTLPVTPQPAVSVVLVLHNQAGLTWRCMCALAQAMDVPAEVIVVDNASSDATGQLLARVDGIVVLPQTENLHFLRAANIGAHEAQGRHVLFLNNDAMLEPGALSAACALLDRQSDVGAVGGKIVLLDGTLQEAGSIVWRDGDCEGYGRGHDPRGAPYQFRRDVDYCSGAFLMVRRDLLERLGGFDPLFAPAYYEDTDLCMRIREAGYRVVYEPRVQLAHVESGSATSTQAVQELMRVHRQLFQTRHGAELARSHHPRSAGSVAARSRPTGARRVLVIDDVVPFPSLGSGNPRACQLLASLHLAGAQLTHFACIAAAFDPSAAECTFPPEIEFATGLDRPPLNTFLRERTGLFDTVFVSRPHNMAQFMAAVRDLPEWLAQVDLVYDAEAIFAAREVARCDVLGLPAQELARQQVAIEAELQLARHADVVLAVTPAEAQRFQNAGCPDVRVLGHSLAARPTGDGFEARRDFLFVGRLEETASPNADSVHWFVTQVMPLLDRLIGTSYGIDCVGGCAPSLRAALASPRLRFHGRVEDISAHYAHARVFIAPTRFAAGIPIKVQEAAAHGLPCVATHLLAAQLGWRDGHELLAASDPASFASACAAAYQDRALWDGLRQNVLLRVAGDCAPASFQACIDGLLQQPHAERAVAPATTAAEVRITSGRDRTEETWSVPPAEREQTEGLFWMAHPQVALRLNRKSSGQDLHNGYDHLMVVLAREGWQFPVPRVASLGCGFGALERGLAGLGMAERIDGYDLADAAIAQARALADAAHLTGLHYHVSDLEQEDLPQGAFDMVFASHSVHHIADLDRLFASVRRSLRPGGVFHLQEYVGPDRFQWTDAQLEGIHAFMDTLPERLRRLPSGIERGRIWRPTVEQVVAVDPSEAICSSAIIGAVGRHFRVLDCRDLGGALLHSGLSGIAQNFKPDSPEDAAHLQRFFEMEDEWMAQGRIGSDFAVVTAVRD